MSPVLSRLHEANRRLRALERSYDELYGCWLRAIDRLHKEEQRAIELEAQVADLEHHLELMSCDNADLERTNAALVDGLRWFDGSTS